jgi:hypothetical protein
MRFRPLIVVVVVAVALGACSDNSGSGNEIIDREAKITKFFEQLETGSNPDYAVVKNGVMGKNPTIIVYGYIDNKEVCEDIVRLFEKSEKDALSGDYQCEPLN